jgi:hypothetical protein
MYVQSPIGGLILYMDNYFKFIETISLEVKYIYKKIYCIGHLQQHTNTPLVI